MQGDEEGRRVGLMRRLRNAVNAALDRWYELSVLRGAAQAKGGFTSAFIRHNEARMLRIPRDAAILGARPVRPEDVASERAELRGVGPRAKSRSVVGWLVLIAAGLGVVYGTVDFLMTGLDRMSAGQFVFEIVVFVVLILLALVLGGVYSRYTERAIAAICQALGASGGSGRRSEVLDWLDRHWRWPLPPELVADTYFDAQGVRRGRPFLILAEWVASNDEYSITSMNRTCVFITCPGLAVRHFDIEPFAGLELPVHVVTTPAGLFAYWALASLGGTAQGKEWAQMLDRLLDLAEVRDIPPATQPREEDENDHGTDR